MSRLFLLPFCSLPFWSVLVLAACTTSTDTGVAPEDSDPVGVQCGDPVVYDLTIKAAVKSGNKAAPGIEVALDDRGYTGEILGSGTTGNNGEVTFTATGVTSLDGCWGVLLDYQLVATDPADTTRTAEDDMNTELHAAIDDGSLVADVTAFPLSL